MRQYLPIPLVLAMAAPAVAGEAPQTFSPEPERHTLQSPKRDGIVVDPDRRCDEQIQQVRDTQGQPKLDRRPASPDRPDWIYAVDQKVGGCSVMVTAFEGMKPVPRVPENGRLLHRAQ